MTRPKRKRNRLSGYDYSRDGAYFLTLCIRDWQCILWDTADAVGARNARLLLEQSALSEVGLLIDAKINLIPQIYPDVIVDAYVIMPNHIHIMLVIKAIGDSSNGRALRAPTVSRVVNQLKGAVTKELGRPIWQKSFYDHIIRDEDDYWTYIIEIDENPEVWTYDEYNI